MLPRCHCRSSNAKVGSVPTPELLRFNRRGPKNSDEALTLLPCGQRESDIVRPISSLKTRWIAAPCQGRCSSTSLAKLTTSANGYCPRTGAPLPLEAPSSPSPQVRFGFHQGWCRPTRRKHPSDHQGSTEGGRYLVAGCGRSSQRPGYLDGTRRGLACHVSQECLGSAHGSQSLSGGRTRMMTVVASLKPSSVSS
jgi:hypothetical protein